MGHLFHRFTYTITEKNNILEISKLQDFTTIPVWLLLSSE